MSENPPKPGVAQFTWGDDLFTVHLTSVKVEQRAVYSLGVDTHVELTGVLTGRELIPLANPGEWRDRLIGLHRRLAQEG